LLLAGLGSFRRMFRMTYRNRDVDIGDPGFPEKPPVEKKRVVSTKPCPKGCGPMADDGGVFTCTCGEQQIPLVREQPF